MPVFVQKQLYSRKKIHICYPLFNFLIKNGVVKCNHKSQSFNIYIILCMIDMQNSFKSLLFSCIENILCVYVCMYVFKYV